MLIFDNTFDNTIWSFRVTSGNFGTHAENPQTLENKRKPRNSNDYGIFVIWRRRRDLNPRTMTAIHWDAMD